MKTKIADNKLALVSSVSNVPIETRENALTAIPSALPESFPKGDKIGRLVGIEDGHPLVHYPGCPIESGLIAQSIVPVTSDKIDKKVLLTFADDNSKLPVIIGFVVEPGAESVDSLPLSVEIDGERLLLTAEREIVLRCGEGSITLTSAGKVIIKGTYVLSRSSGYNKIKGAAIDIN